MATSKKSFWEKLSSNNKTAIIVALIALFGTISYAWITKPPAGKEGILKEVLNELNEASVSFNSNKINFKGKTWQESLEIIINTINQTQKYYDKVFMYLSEEDQNRIESQLTRFNNLKNEILRDGENPRSKIDTAFQKKTIEKAFEYMYFGVEIRENLMLAIKKEMKHIGHEIKK